MGFNRVVARQGAVEEEESAISMAVEEEESAISMVGADRARALHEKAAAVKTFLATLPQRLPALLAQANQARHPSVSFS
ncbi:hypothetical protein T484DRAFT_1866993 [Baffinella frigidus]|nr:hypothetical protein T484DRAFT_1866993 [Cryptophyta sp. CCMP2293]